MPEARGLEQRYEPLTVAVRALIDLTIRTEADAAAVSEATRLVEAARELLSRDVMPSSFGLRVRTDGQGVASGNVVIGTRNPVAPPLVVHHEPGGAVWTEFNLGAAYEGPAGHVHGGVCALVLDHVLAATAHEPGRPAYTGTLTMRYERGTPLGPLRARAWVQRVEGAKTFAMGEIADAQGVTVRAEGIFIHPKGVAGEPSL
ncbi:MAG: uncharacterized protein K0R01_201 [Mycobacterium sp.]|jgi:acyl-coenzyme A thioesterase PaaI-like protein|nr:uncharacterized protein [Mycobacterium sp.]